MPPEPLPWDRKDFYKERKHERTESQPQQSLTPRWRDSSSMPAYQNGSFREFGRWGSAEFRRPPGHGKQGSWHLLAEVNGGHGYMSSRSGDKILNDESFHQSVSHGEGKSSRNSSRENNRGAYCQRDWRGHSWEMSNGSPNTPGRPHDVNNELRSVDDMPSYPSHTHSDFVHSWDQLQKDHDNKTIAVNGLGTGQRSEKENVVGSMDWKPLKWSRSGSLSSRGSGFSHSSSSKSLGVDPGEGKPESQQKNLTPVQSPSGDAAACVTSAAPSDETMSRKKQRLGWGEGLAKYEKKKVEVPYTNMSKGEAVLSVGNTELNNSLSQYLADKSPRVLGFSDCASPATPSSVACSSSPGVEEKSFVKAANIDNDSSNLCCSPSLGSQNYLEGQPFNLEKLDINSIINMGSSLIDLLQSDDASTLDSNFVRSTAVSKLLLFKGHILKELEVTESELDSLESELKLLKADSGSGCPCPATSSSLLADENGKACEERETVFTVIPRPTPLKIDSCGDTPEGKDFSNCVLAEVNADIKDGDIDSPGTATSKFVEPSPLEKAVPSSDILEVPECSSDLGAVQLTVNEEVILAPDATNEGVCVSIFAEGSAQKKKDANVPEFSNAVSGEDILYNSILSTNKELASRASEVFIKLLPNDQCRINASEFANVAPLQTGSSVRAKIAMRKRHLRVKEKILTLKFKAYQYAWKEEMRSPFIRKYRAKSQKKYELSLRSHGGFQKHRSSIRSQLASPARCLSLESNAEIFNFANKLLSDSHVKICRDALKMPALLLDEKEKQVSRFISSNGLVVDPCAVEKERSLINPWTPEEREVFMDKLAVFGKDFGKIASFLDHKTTADCVAFYYENHKSEWFEKTKKKPDLSKQPANSTYLLTSGKKWSRELNAASLDVLGAASVIAARAENGMRSRKTSSVRIFSGGGRFDPKSSQNEDSVVGRSNSYDIFVNDRETAAADVLAGICGSMSSEAMSSCITSSAGPGESCHREWKSRKVDSMVKRQSTSDLTQSIEDDTCSDESCGEMDPADWTDEEKSVFIQAVSAYGKDFTMISRCVGTRSRDQCKIFFSKARKCLGLDMINSRTRNIGTPMSDDANGGGSDLEDACVLESSVVSSDKLGSKVEDLSTKVASVNMDASNPSGKGSIQTDLNLSGKNKLRVVIDRRTEAVETMVSDVCRSERISESCDDIDVDSAKRESVQNHVRVISGKNTIAERGLSNVESLSVIEPKSVFSCFTEGSGNDSEAQGTLLAKKGLDEHDTKCYAESSCQSVSRIDSSKFSDESIDKISCSGFSLNTKNLHQVPLNLDAGEKPSALLLPEKSSSAKDSALDDSDAFQSETVCIQDRLSSTLDYQENDDKKYVSADKSDSLSGKPLVDPAESSQSLGGYPLQVSTMKEMIGDISRNQLPEVQSLATSERGVTDTYLSQDSYLRKCNSSEIPVKVQNLDQANNHRKSHSRSMSDTEKPCSNGNVKLFGQILKSSSEDDGQEETHFQKRSMKSTNLKLNGHSTNLKFGGLDNVDGNATFSKFDRNDNYHASEDASKSSYGYWDGNRIQTGLTSLPESAIIVAKYPAAFVNYPAASSSQMVQQSPQNVVRSNDRNLNGVTVFPTREASSSNGTVDSQTYRSRDNSNSKLTAITMDTKQQQEMLTEIRRRNGLDSISNIQQQGRGVVGMNVSGRGGGVLVGESCPNLSDPVAVLRMQYAKTEQYGGGQNPGIIREEDSWRSKGDIGR